MFEDFYFAYEYNEKKKTAYRLYRRINHDFERYDKVNKKGWVPAPEISCIYIGEDVFYDEITEDQANEIIKNWNLLKCSQINSRCFFSFLPIFPEHYRGEVCPFYIFYLAIVMDFCRKKY